MKRTTFLLLPAVALSFSGTPVFAHTGTSRSDPVDQMMRQMMGAPTMDVMEQMEEQMMGAEDHARMEGLMGKMTSGTLSAGEQREMVNMMQDQRVMPGAMTMMMRMMLAQYGGGAAPAGMPAMTQGMPFGSWGAAFPWVFWVTLALLWVALALAILALVKWLGKNPR